MCALAKDVNAPDRLRSYSNPSRRPNIPATISEAALATSAATSFFDSVLIGEREFVDCALGTNNPVDAVEEEATDIWCPDTGSSALIPLVQCFVSIGTGQPDTTAVEYQLLGFVGTLEKIATETENTERKFAGRWRGHLDHNGYFRLNVEQGLQKVGLAEYKKRGRIAQATDRYLNHQDRVFRIRDCVNNLKEKQGMSILNSNSKS